MPRAPRRLLPSALAAVLGALLLVGSAGAGSALAAPAPTVDGDEPPTAETAPATAELVIAPTESALSPAAEDIVFTVLVRSLDAEADEALAGGILHLRLDTRRLATRDELVATSPAAPEGPVADPTVPLAEIEVGPTAPGDEQTLTVAVPPAAIPVLDDGVYRVEAELQISGEGLTASAPVVWRGVDGLAHTPLSVIVPLVLPESVPTMPTRDELTAEAVRLDALLTAAEGWRATLAIDPRLIAGIRAYGTTAPAPAVALLERLESSPLPSFLLQFADADPAAQADLGFETLLAPIGLSYLTRLGSFDATADPDAGGESPSGLPGEAPAEDGGSPGEADAADEAEPADDDDTADDAPTTPTRPGLEQLLAWPGSDLRAWPADGRATTPTLDLLRASGLTGLVLRDDNVSAATAPRATIAGFDTLIADTRLAAAARTALAGPTQVERDAGSATLAAELALAAEASTTGLVLALDRGAVADAEAPAEVLDRLAGLEWVTAVSSDELPVGEAAFQAAAPTEPTEPRLEMLASALEASSDVDALAPLLEHPGYLLQYQRVRLLAAFATRHAEPDTDLTAVADRITARDRELLQGVQLLPSENTQLVGVQSRVPVLLHNALPFDALVTLRVAPVNAAVEVPQRRFPDQRVAEGGNTTVLVPVDSRVSSGESALSVQVADRSDDEVFATAVLRLTLRSSVEMIMLVVLGALAALLLGFGVWRSVRRHRRATRDAAPDHDRDRPLEPHADRDPTAE